MGQLTPEQRRIAAASRRKAAALIAALLNDATSSPPEQPQPAAGETEPAPAPLDIATATTAGPAVPSLGSHHYEWCTTCKAWTVAAGTVTLLTATGAMPIGRWAVCETCGHTPEAPRA